MRTSFTAVIEQGNTFTADFSTEPYETAWATEARWFVRVLDLSGEDVSLHLFPEISPDGLFWCEEGSPPIVAATVGMQSLPLREFGHWLRLRGEFRGSEPRVKLLIYLALKE
ncbi:MAG: hypothetical protein ACR2OU_12090 [Thermomicrobiales bacterium]